MFIFILHMTLRAANFTLKKQSIADKVMKHVKIFKYMYAHGTKM